jgi:hypothetical protein
MKTSQCLLLLVAGLVVGLFIGGSGTGPNANAQGISNAVTSPRYQISAWAITNNPSRASAERGCYILDTVTGEVWHAGVDGKPLKVTEKLK